LHHIAFCTTELRNGGAERCLVELATRLDRSKFRCSVVSLAPPPRDSMRNLAPRLEAAGVPIHYLSVTRTTQAWRAFRELTRIWRRDTPDLVQTFLFHANVIGRLAASRAGVPHIVSGIRVAERRSRWRLRLERWTAGSVERHVCVSEAVAKFSRDVGGLTSDRIEVIPNGIDVRTYENVSPAPLTSLGVKQGQRIVVCIGRLDPQKGQLWLLDHASAWLKHCPEHDLVFVGDGPDRAPLESKIAALGLQDRVHLTGFRGDIPAILAAADLLVLPSAWEGMPNVVLEAMAAGRAIVARDVEGVRELLGAPSASPQVTPVDDAQLLSQQVVAILSDVESRASFEEQNRARAAREYSLESMVRRYESLYEDLLVRQVKK
jgi:glycosyltransferase involved in cell wall biosynthesis